MSNDFFNAAPLEVGEQTKARSAAVNAIGAAVEAAFGLLPGKDALNQDRTAYYTATGSVNQISIAMTPTLQAYVEGMKVRVKATKTNTGTATLNIDSLGAVVIRNLSGSVIPAGDISSGDIHEFVYNGTNFIQVTPSRSVLQAGTPIAAILGVVSESGGDPTGAVFQNSYSSGNGYAFRHASGLQVCLHTVSQTYLDTYALYYDWTFEESFATGTTPFVTGTFDRGTGTITPVVTNVLPPVPGSVSRNGARIHTQRIQGTTDFGPSDTLGSWLFAVGVWNTNLFS